MKTFTEHAPMIAVPRSKTSDRAGRWVTAQVGRFGRSVTEVAGELECDWHTVMDAVSAYGTPLIEDPERIGATTALGLDETLFTRRGKWKSRTWCTSIVDVNYSANEVCPEAEVVSKDGEFQRSLHVPGMIAGACDNPDRWSTQTT